MESLLPDGRSDRKSRPGWAKWTQWTNFRGLEGHCSIRAELRGLVPLRLLPASEAFGSDLVADQVSEGC